MFILNFIQILVPLPSANDRPYIFDCNDARQNTTFPVCALQTYEAGPNSSPNPSCSQQSGTVKISRHRGPRVQTPPVSWVLPGDISGSPIYKGSSFSPDIMISFFFFFKFPGLVPILHSTWGRSIGRHASFLKDFVFVSSKHTLTRKQGINQLCACNFLWRSSKANMFVFHLNIKKEGVEREGKKKRVPLKRLNNSGC